MSRTTFDYKSIRNELKKNIGQRVLVIEQYGISFTAYTGNLMKIGDSEVSGPYILLKESIFINNLPKNYKDLLKLAKSNSGVYQGDKETSLLHTHLILNLGNNKPIITSQLFSKSK